MVLIIVDLGVDFPGVQPRKLWLNFVKTLILVFVSFFSHLIFFTFSISLVALVGSFLFASFVLSVILLNNSCNCYINFSMEESSILVH